MGKWTPPADYKPKDAMQELVDKVADMIERTGKLPWKREWNPDKCIGPQSPFNAATGHAYHGINVLILGMDPRAYQTADPRWATFQQAKEKGWHVKKGERSTTVFFYKPITVEDEKAKDGERTIPILKHFPVFHASQIEGVPPYVPPTAEQAPWIRPEAIEVIVKNLGVKLSIGGDRAFYAPALDLIQMPPDVAFSSREYWAATLSHEGSHATADPTRLNRDITGVFGSEKYCLEEARAELSAAFVCNTLNLPTNFDNHAAYVVGWLSKLRKDKRELFRCAADAQRIADYLLKLHPDFAANLDSQSERPRGAPAQQPEQRPAA